MSMNKILPVIFTLITCLAPYGASANSTGNGGLIGLGILSSPNTGSGALTGIDALNGDQALGLDIGGTSLISLGAGNNAPFGLPQDLHNLVRTITPPTAIAGPLEGLAGTNQLITDSQGILDLVIGANHDV